MKLTGLPVLAAFTVLVILGVSSGCTKRSEDPSISATPVPTATETPAANASSTPSSAPGASGASAIATTPSASSIDLTPDAQGLSKAVVVMKTSRGTIKFKLYPKDAPKTVTRFVELVQSKFYNGLTFHRIEPGFVVQTGDPKSKAKDPSQVGTGGSGQKLKSEFNGRKHVRGTVAMARTSSDVDSADSQFYLTLGTFPHLDGNYTIFGQVVDFGEKQSDKDALERIRQWDEIVDMHVE